jgi:hypothetical protein
MNARMIGPSLTRARAESKLEPAVETMEET